MAHILGIGNATLDIVNEVDSYPPENAEVRAIGQRITRGGNCANTLSVLSLLGHRCSLAAMLAEDSRSIHVRRNLQRHKIDLGPCRVQPSGHTPTSYICLNRRSGSRTIVHYRELPEYGFEEFAAIELADYDWLHFEGRNVSQTRHMLDRVRSEKPECPISVEIEKPRADIETLFVAADVLLFSREYALSNGFTDALTFLSAMAPIAKGVDLICTWENKGAAARTASGETFFSDALQVSTIVDTLGAGDTFNAGIIDALLRGLELYEALEAANRLAGKKCEMMGFAGISN